MIPISYDQFKVIVADPSLHGVYLNGEIWDRDDAIERIMAGEEPRTRAIKAVYDDEEMLKELYLLDPTRRELEAHYRSKGKSRAQAEKLAAAHLNEKEEKAMSQMSPLDAKRARLEKLENRFQEIAFDKNKTSEYYNVVEEINSIKAEFDRPVHAPLTLQNGPLGGHGGVISGVTGNGKGYALLGPRDKKDFRSLFGTDEGYRWPDDKNGSFFEAVFSGRFDPRLIRAGMTETVPSDGGFLVPSQTAEKIHAVSLENEIIMPRCFVQPMKSNECKIPGMVIGDHSANLYGGFTASYTAETGTISEADPKTRSMTLNAKKLTGLIRFSSELAQDIPGGEGQIINLCGKGLSWYRDRAFLKGTGSGEPLGILNSGCLVTVAAEGGQQADTIIYENLTKMMSRMFAGSFGNSFWLCHQSTIPQLLTLSVSVGTGGDHIPVMTRSGGGFEILTRPVVFTEKTEKLGDKGDIMLIDASQYVVGLRSEMRFDTSIHVAFTTDEILARLIERHDGQPLWDTALTLPDGTTTVSPFVALAAR